MSTNKSLTLRVLTPEGIIFENPDLVAINVPLADGGTIGIRAAHAPLIAETVQGEVTFQTESLRDSVLLYAGVLDIRDNIVTILTVGEGTEPSDEAVETSQMTYDRIIQSLISHLAPQEEQSEH